MRHPLWLFDLDNTLHDASGIIFPYINQSMTAYVADRLGLSHSEASQVRERYWRRYGATLLGLIRHHQIDPHEFLRETHKFDEITGQHLEDLAHIVSGEKNLRLVLNRLPGKKILLTNAPKAYAEKITKELGIHQCFHEVEAIEDMVVHQKWRPKPDTLMLRKILQKYKVAPSQAILVDDTLGHLLEYSNLGLKTVWFKRHVRTHTHNRGRVSLEVQSIHQLFKRWQKIR